MTKNQHRRLIINYRPKNGFKYLADINMGGSLTRRIYFLSDYSLIEEDSMFLLNDLEGELLNYMNNK